MQPKRTHNALVYTKRDRRTRLQRDYNCLRYGSTALTGILTAQQTEKNSSPVREHSAEILKIFLDFSPEHEKIRFHYLYFANINIILLPNIADPVTNH